MVQIKKTCTSYDISHDGKSTRVEGSAQLTDTGLVQNMHLNFYVGENNVGNASYSEYEGSISCNYNFSDPVMKTEIEQQTDAIIAEIKQQSARK